MKKTTTTKRRLDVVLLVEDDLVDQAAKQVCQEISPITDVRASETHREKMAEVLVRRALKATRDDLNRKLSNG